MLKFLIILLKERWNWNYDKGKYFNLNSNFKPKLFLIMIFLLNNFPKAYFILTNKLGAHLHSKIWLRQSVQRELPRGRGRKI